MYELFSMILFFRKYVSDQIILSQFDPTCKNCKKAAKRVLFDNSLIFSLLLGSTIISSFCVQEEKKTGLNGAAAKIEIWLTVNDLWNGKKFVIYWKTVEKFSFGKEKKRRKMEPRRRSSRHQQQMIDEIVISGFEHPPSVSRYLSINTVHVLLCQLCLHRTLIFRCAG